MNKKVIHKRYIARETYPRLDHFLVDSLEGMGLSRSQIVKLLQDNRVKLNDTPVTKKNLEVLEGDAVEIEFPEEDKPDYTPSFELTKLFEDEYLLIIDKPYGIPVHKGAGEHIETILDVYRYYYPQINEIPTDGEERPGIVHRLDKDTSGVLILAKDLITMKRLQKQFKRREIHKTYLALVAGQIRYQNGTIDAYIARSTKNRTRFKVVDGYNIENAREAVTEYSVIKQFNDFCYVRLNPLTGRTHQIRVHMAYHGNPVLGDPVYGKAHTFERLALHAYSIEFRHPITETIIEATSPFPLIFRKFLANTSKNEKNQNI